MQRKTKIVATLGPATNNPEVLTRLLAAGVNVVRLNFSHGSPAEHTARANMVRAAAESLGRSVAILVDLQGPKIRVGKFASGKIQLTKGDKFILDANCKLGNQERVGLDYENLPNDVETGVILLLNDGAILLEVERVEDAEIHCVVIQGGELKDNKGINRKGGGLTAPALTDKDKEDMFTAAAIHADFVAVSFPKTGADMAEAKQLLKAAGCNALVIAKIERTEALVNLEDILNNTDGIMVARGDLAVEIGDAAVPPAQKRMLRMARERDKLTITATQMMESMIENAYPTRAEISDVANAVLDGTDAVMLSGESAAGKYPVETVQYMAEACLLTEEATEYSLDLKMLQRSFTRVDQSVAMAALFTASNLKVKAIVPLTQTGSTALWLSRVNCGVPIYAITPELAAYSRLSLYRDVFPMMLNYETTDRDALLDAATALLQEKGLVQKDDLVLFTVGELVGQVGGTNTMKIVKVGAKD